MNPLNVWMAINLFTWKEIWLSLGLISVFLGIFSGSSDCKRWIPIPYPNNLQHKEDFNRNEEKRFP